MQLTRQDLAAAVDASVSVAGVIRQLGLRQGGGTHSRIKRLIAQFALDTTHFTGQGWSRGRVFAPMLPPSHYLREWPEGHPPVRGDRLAQALRAIGRKYLCAACGNDGTWRGARLSLHVDHISGERWDCRPQNLRFLCPNCHAQTATYARRKPGAGRAGGGSRTRTPEGTAF